MVSLFDDCLSRGIAAINHSQRREIPFDPEMEKGRLIAFSINAALGLLSGIGARNLANYPGRTREWRIVLHYYSKISLLYAAISSYFLSTGLNFIWAGIKDGCLDKIDIWPITRFKK